MRDKSCATGDRSSGYGTTVAENGAFAEHQWFSFMCHHRVRSSTSLEDRTP